jgi:hypothetical protein
MAQVKGTLLMETVRMMRANKDRNFNQYLQEKDLEVISKRILPSNWYPLDTYERATFAIFKEVAGGKLDVAQAWGKFVGEDLIKRFYSNLTRETDMMIVLEKFKLIRLQWFKFENPGLNPIEVKAIDKNSAQIILRTDHPTPFEPYTHQTLGTFQRLIELCGKQEVKGTIGAHKWDGNAPFAEITFTWKD